MWDRPVAIIPRTVQISSPTGVESRAGPIAASQPTAITQPRTDNGPIIRLEREEASVAMAHDNAAAKPPRIAIVEILTGAAAEIEPIRQIARLLTMQHSPSAGAHIR